MNLIRNLSIRNKLLLITLIPLFALFYFLGERITEEFADQNRIEKVYADVLKAEMISNVVHQVQQERGFSMNYVLDREAGEKMELFAQRAQTDKALFNLGRLLDKQEGTANLQLDMEKLSEIRDKINDAQTSADVIQQAFAEINLSLIDQVNRTALFSENPDIKNLLTAHMFLLYGKEYFGQMRANLNQWLSSPEGSRGEEYARFATLKGKYEVNLESYAKNTTDELSGYYLSKMSDPSVRRVQQALEGIKPGAGSGQLSLEEGDWWINSVAFLNILKEIEDYSSATIRETAQTELDRIAGTLVKNLIIASVVVLLIVVLLYHTIRFIVTSVQEIKQAAERIILGEVDFSLSVNSRDEIGNLATSFNKLIEVTKEYALAADEIGRGSYGTEVKVRGNADTLGRSLNEMKENLRKLSDENEIRTWLLTGNNEVNDTLRGEKDVRELAQDVVAKLTTYLEAQIGAIYLSENEHLAMVGSYAFQNRKDNTNIIKKGQGLVGQSALEKKPIVFSQVPEDYVKINSGLGSTSPRNIVVYPFQYDGEVKGVIEIGAAADFSENDMQFLEIVAENIGIAFNSSESRTKMKELLEETQRQAEELEAQQEELRQINEELQEKTQLLETSEAELKAQQEELQQTNEELEEKADLLEDQKGKLELAKIEVETKARELEITNKYKSEFLANMSHELRTPLNSILILAQLLAENKAKVLGSKEVEYAKNIQSSGADLLNLINEILDLSKVESGKMELDVTDVPISGIKEDVESMFNEVAKAKSIDFKVNCSKNLLSKTVSTDQQRVEQVLRNLLSNAFKFTDRGGSVSLDISAQDANQGLKDKWFRQLGKVIAFSVSDTGIGIPKNKQSIIFEAFQQADGSTKRKYGGTGLGLSISRELATALGGEIHLESEEGKGSTFTFYLPLEFDINTKTEERAGAAASAQPKPAVIEVSTETAPMDPPLAEEGLLDDRHHIHADDKSILIIEDDVRFANLLLEFIREKNYKGILAHQGNAGLSLARHYRPTAIILDMKLPVMDGSEVLRHLKNDPDLRHIPVQVISGYDRRKEGFDLGAFDFLKKPLVQQDFDQSLERIEDFLNRKLKKLLIVEDNKQQNQAMRDLIGNGDVKSFSAYSGSEAFELMQRERFDCIIIDLGLPDMTGFELLEKIKKDDGLRKIPVIVHTGRDLSRQEAARLEKLADTVVLKTANSSERLLDETTLFLHRVESNLPREKQQIIRKLHRSDEVLLNKKVLIVDDDIRNIYSLTNALEEEGMQCITAENGKEAIAVLQEQKDTDLVLMDVMMPEMDGYEATQAIRKMKKFQKLPVIALTAKAMKGDREKCLSAGMSDYVAKPVNIQQLLSLMRVWLYK